jgi:hypothetical protein
MGLVPGTISELEDSLMISCSNHLRRTVVFDILLLGACIASLKLEGLGIFDMPASRSGEWKNPSLLMC